MNYNISKSQKKWKGECWAGPASCSLSMDEQIAVPQKLEWTIDCPSASHVTLAYVSFLPTAGKFLASLTSNNHPLNLQTPFLWPPAQSFW